MCCGLQLGVPNVVKMWLQHAVVMRSTLLGKTGGRRKYCDSFAEITGSVDSHDAIFIRSPSQHRHMTNMPRAKKVVTNSVYVGEDTSGNPSTV